MDTARQRQMIEQFIAAYNSFDVDGLLALLAPDVRFENYSGGTLTVAATGIDEFRELAEKGKTMFSERQQRVTSMDFHGDAAMVAIAYRGVLAADVPKGPSAGTILELKGRSEYSFADGYITKIVDRS